MVDHIQHSIAEIGEATYDEQFEGMLTYLMVKDFFLVCPIEYHAGSILEMQFFIVYAVVLEEQVYQVPWIQELFVSMKGRVALDNP